MTYNDYPDYEKSIYKLVWKYYRKCSLAFDELLSEANMGFIKAVDTFDEKKACFHTHLVITVESELRNYLNKKDKLKTNNKTWILKTIRLNDTPVISKEPNPEQNAIFNELIDSLSKEAKEVIGTILNTPTELIELVRSMTANRKGGYRLSLKNVTCFLQNSGWRWKTIRNSYREIRKAFDIEYTSNTIWR